MVPMRLSRANIRGGKANKDVNMTAAHVPWHLLIKMIQPSRHRKAERRASIFREKRERPNSLKNGTNKNPSISPSPDLTSY